MTAKDLKKRKRKATVGLLFFLIVQVVLIILARKYNYQIVKFFINMDNCYVAKVFLETKNKLTIASSFVSVIACIYITSQGINNPKLKTEKIYNEQIKLWCACFVQIPACLVSYNLMFTMLMLGLYTYFEYLKYKKKM